MIKVPFTPFSLVSDKEVNDLQESYTNTLTAVVNIATTRVDEQQRYTRKRYIEVCVYIIVMYIFILYIIHRLNQISNG